MQARRAILVNGSRLMRDIVKRVVEKHQGFRVVQVIDDMEVLSSPKIEWDAEYMFVILAPEGDIPENLKNHLFLQKPTLKIVCFWVNGSHVRLEWLEREQKEFTGSTVNELTLFLQEELRSNYEGSEEVKGG